MRLAAMVLGLVLTLLPAAARAERLVSTLSNTSVEITSSFDGETLSMFGNIEPDSGADKDSVQGPFHVIIAVTGPLADRVARLKTNVFGIWLNTEQVTFERFPSYFRVLSSGRLTDITNMVVLNQEAILPEAQATMSAHAGWWNSTVFARELVRLMTGRGFFGVDEKGVKFLSETAYTAQLTLPHDIANGPFIAATYVFKNGKLIARSSEGFSVRKIGFERFIGTAASEQPLLYGLVCVILAVFTGWLGGVVFKR